MLGLPRNLWNYDNNNYKTDYIAVIYNNNNTSEAVIVHVFVNTVCDVL